MKKGISERNRSYLDRLHRDLRGGFGAKEAASVLKLPLPRARRLLTWLFSQGWLTRIQRGLYATVPMGVRVPADWRLDPWIVASKVFEPCYVGGWSACEHWGLTEQLFRTTLVMTAKPIKRSHVEIQGMPYRICGKQKDQVTDVRQVWRDSVPLRISGPSRTVADLLHHPELGGGIQHVAAVLQEYMAGKQCDHEVLLLCLEKRGNRAAYKRLGYLLETLGTSRATKSLVTTCLDRISPGISKLDPRSRKRGKIVKRWNLYLNVDAVQLKGSA